MIEKSKILSIMLISCVISSLFAISFSSGEVECECDLTEVELNIQTLNSSISTLNDSINFANSQILVINNTLNDLGNVSEIMNNITYISDYLINVTNSIENITDLYNTLLINFTNYVELLESFGNVTELLDSINDAIADIEGDISDIQSDISDIQSDLSTLQTNLDKYSQIGSGNSVWMPLTFQYAEPLDSFRSADYAICNTGANDMILTYVLPIPTNSGGLYLYISGFRVLLSDADSTDYVTSVGVYRILYNDVNQISLDASDLQSAQLKETTFTGVDCHLYNIVIVVVSCICTTSNECDIRGVLLRYYYA